MLYTYMNSYHTPERMVVAGVGTHHEEFVEIVKDSFLKKPIWETYKEVIDPSREKDLSISQYTGGYLTVS